MKAKLLFYTLWNIGRLEEKLQKFENDGFRLNRIVGSYFFEFAESTPKDCKYVITYDLAKDNKKTMYECEQRLLSECSAIRVALKQAGINVFGIVGNNCDLSSLFEYRKAYFRYIFRRNALISLIFVAVNIFYCLGLLHKIEFGS